MSVVSCFVHERWQDIDALALMPGVIFHRDGRLYELMAPAYVKGGVTHLPAQALPADDVPIKVMVGEFAKGLDHIGMAMDMTGGDLREYEGGDAQILNLEAGPGHVYSPRLPLAQLEIFCQAHLNGYQAFFDQHEVSLDHGEVIPMEIWWEGNTDEP